MKKQITLTVLGAMLFTGVIFSTKAEESTTVAASESAAVNPVATTPTVVAENIQNNVNANSADASVATKENSWLSKLGTNLKSYKWQLVGGAAVIVGVYVAFKLYQAYNEEEVEQEIQLV